MGQTFHVNSGGSR